MAVLLVLAITACGNGSDSLEGAPTTSIATGTSGDTLPATVPEPPTAAESVASTTPTTTTTVPADALPDFALELGTGGTFVLSEEARPVFLVFWAEW